MLVRLLSFKITLIFLLYLQIHIDIPRMSPEALILQPKVTEVRTGVRESLQRAFSLLGAVPKLLVQLTIFTHSRFGVALEGIIPRRNC